MIILLNKYFYKNMIGRTGIRFSSSLWPRRTYHHGLIIRFTPVQARLHQRPGHHATPLTNPPLQGPQLPLGKLAGIGPLQAFHQHLGGRLGIRLEPQEDLRPNLLEGIFPRSPTVRC